jgi:glutaredoxin
MWCVRVKQFLEEQGIEYEDIDVSVNQEAAMEMVEKTGQMGVPVINARGRFIVGFNPDAIMAALGRG